MRYSDEVVCESACEFVIREPVAEQPGGTLHETVCEM